MKEVEQGYNYKVSNNKRGRQSIRFHKESLLVDKVKDGTKVSELLEVVKRKLIFENINDRTNIDNAELCKITLLITELNNLL